ncbi:hypothetical protein TCAL_02664 [Tigriopus californicus]|uniref:Proteasome subunit beta n=1 Tax=Tigriopus californicus TaxID=6832 RepID=A0A553PGV9_TIGCA|nr:proteasome subunit beta type-3-like [Tigriopus californicus]TRY76915.1 hypothetical protein TCAL_02664 [Tigriopus californicus]|eukprot:TCALIF_02664-PA protein Name:"Similar to psmb3 Proteasome subunit beta type-3 (Oncorhynchus mykiss)" AED:0.07 eAED:0.07 QI:270/1/1/1/1/1/3/129/205
MSILSYNGGAVIAMKGGNCLAVATDLRYGVELRTVTTDFPKMFEIHPHLWVGLPGLASDTQTVLEKIRFRVKMYELQENRPIQPETFAAMLSNMLYERRFGPFFIEPIVAGLNPHTQSIYLCSMDLIGNVTTPEDFVVGGTAEEQLLGMCETVWSPDMDPDQLFESVSQALVNAVDRDASAGWGAEITIIEPHQITTRRIKTRMD